MSPSMLRAPSLLKPISLVFAARVRLR